MRVSRTIREHTVLTAGIRVVNQAGQTVIYDLAEIIEADIIIAPNLTTMTIRAKHARIDVATTTWHRLTQALRSALTRFG